MLQGRGGGGIEHECLHEPPPQVESDRTTRMMPVSEFLRKVTSRDSVNHTHQLMLFRNEKVGASESRQRLVCTNQY